MQGRSKSPYGNTEGIATLTNDRLATQNVKRGNNQSKVTEEEKKKGTR